MKANKSAIKIANEDEEMTTNTLYVLFSGNSFGTIMSFVTMPIIKRLLKIKIY